MLAQIARQGDLPVQAQRLLAACASAPVAPTYIDQLGRALTDPGQYALPFEAASVLILLAMIGAIWVARERRPAEMIAERAQIAAEDADELEIQQALEGASTAAGTPVPPAAIAEH